MLLTTELNAPTTGLVPAVIVTPHNVVLGPVSSLSLEDKPGTNEEEEVDDEEEEDDVDDNVVVVDNASLGEPVAESSDPVADKEFNEMFVVVVAFVVAF